LRCCAAGRRRSTDIIRNKHGNGRAETLRHPKSATTYFTTGDLASAGFSSSAWIFPSSSA
jgi:hypothetical protein